MSWTRKAGGFWMDPQGNKNKCDSHDDWAWTLLLNQIISEEEQTEPVIKDKPLAGPQVEYKGTGGAEAKAEAERRLREEGVTTPAEATAKLINEGWQALDENQQAPVAAAVAQVSGLGEWRVTSAPVDFFPNVVHKPEAALGKQWLVVDNKGKKVAEGPSRKWAERSASRLGWFKRQQSLRH